MISKLYRLVSATLPVCRSVARFIDTDQRSRARGRVLGGGKFITKYPSLRPKRSNPPELGECAEIAASLSRLAMTRVGKPRRVRRAHRLLQRLDAGAHGAPYKTRKISVIASEAKQSPGYRCRLIASASCSAFCEPISSGLPSLSSSCTPLLPLTLYALPLRLKRMPQPPYSLIGR